MTPTKFLLCLAVLAAGAGSAAAASSDGVLYVPHARVEALDSHGGGPLLLNSRFKVQTARRVAPGVVELHTRDTDVFYIVQGDATFVTGGEGTNMHEVSPGEWRGKSIAGGTPHHLEAGDIIVIPNGVPHQFTSVNGTFLYFVVKITQQ